MLRGFLNVMANFALTIFTLSNMRKEQLLYGSLPPTHCLMRDIRVPSLLKIAKHEDSTAIYTDTLLYHQLFTLYIPESRNHTLYVEFEFTVIVFIVGRSVHCVTKAQSVTSDLGLLLYFLCSMTAYLPEICPRLCPSAAIINMDVTESNIKFITHKDVL
jgi:hypothetical protein